MCSIVALAARTPRLEFCSHAHTTHLPLRLLVTREYDMTPKKFSGYPQQPQLNDNSPRAAQLVRCIATMHHESTSTTSPTVIGQKLWTLETIGIADSIPVCRRAVRRAAVPYEYNRYTVGIPKRSTTSTLPNNCSGVVDRLEQKLIQLERDPVGYRRYHEGLLKFVERGFAREIPSSVSPRVSARDASFYMPQHAVVSTKSSAKNWRIVFDCSAKAKGVLRSILISCRDLI